MADGAGGDTCFPALNVAVSPRVGRAVCWTRHRGASEMLEMRELTPVSEDESKWMLQKKSHIFLYLFQTGKLIVVVEGIFFQEHVSLLFCNSKFVILLFYFSCYIIYFQNVLIELSMLFCVMDQN